jgi:deferrochelatase/peroxidase EfeB
MPPKPLIASDACDQLAINANACGSQALENLRQGAGQPRHRDRMPAVAGRTRTGMKLWLAINASDQRRHQHHHRALEGR